MNNDKISDLLLEQYLLGELHADKVEEIEMQINKDPELNNRFEELKDLNKQFLKHYPATEVLKDIIKIDSKEKKIIKIIKKTILGFPVPRILIPAMITALLMVVFIIPQFRANSDSSLYSNKGGITRIKGDADVIKTDPKIFLFRKKDINIIEKLKHNDIAKPGDLVQIAYIAGQKKYGIIISMDGKGVLTLHYPEINNKNNRLIQGRKVYIKHSYELDDAPEFEQFWFITSMETIDVKGIIKMIEKDKNIILNDNSAKLSLPDNFTQESILIKKGQKK